MDAELERQGVLQGIGCGLTLPMVFAIPSQWFKRRRGLATGIVIAGAALGGAVSSLIVQVSAHRSIALSRLKQSSGYAHTTRPP